MGKKQLIGQSEGTEIGELVETYQTLNSASQKRLLGYMEALKEDM